MIPDPQVYLAVGRFGRLAVRALAVLACLTVVVPVLLPT